MAIDTSIYNSLLRPPKSVAEYDNEFITGQQNRLALRTDMQKADQYSRGIDQEKSLADAYAGALGDDGQVDRNRLYSSVARSGLGAKLPAIQKSYADQDKAAAEVKETASKTAKANQETASHQFEIAGQLAGSWAMNPAVTKPQIQAGLAAALHSGVISPQIAQAKLDELNGVGDDPKSLNGWANGVLTQVMKAKDQIAQTTPDANARLNSDTSIKTNALSNATTQRGQNMTAATAAAGQAGEDRRAEAKNAASDAPAGMSPEAIKNAAARYNNDGTLPPLGMGKQGASARSQILNEAANQGAAAGLSGTDQRIQQVGNKANAAALSKLQQQQTMVGSFERNFNKNADIALEYSAKVDRSGIPIVNKWVNAGKRAVTGDADLAAFDASVKAVSNEYAKIISGSMGNTATALGEIKKIESLLNAAQTPAQVASVIGLMKRETANRMAGFEEEKTALRGSMSGGKPGAAAPAAKPSLGDIFGNSK